MSESEQIPEEEGRRCRNCKHFKADPNAGISYFGEPHPHAGWCQHSSLDSPMMMLSGDWCENHEDA